MAKDGELLVPDHIAVHIDGKKMAEAVTKAVPICPNCGAKFSHSAATSMCVKCKIPDEIVSGGPHLIARWKKNQQRKDHTKSKAKAARKAAHSGTRMKKVNKHGRKGAKNVVRDQPTPRYRRSAKAAGVEHTGA